MDIGHFFQETLQVRDNDLVDQLTKLSAIMYLDKGELLVRQGDQQNDFIFLVRGIFRGYYLDINGRDVTDCIGFKSGTPAMSVMIDNNSSPISIEAVTESVFICIPGEALLSLIKDNLMLLQLYNTMLQTALHIHWELKVMVSQHTALERYQWFLENYPGLIDQISNRHIASYLGMAPVTLSRMRRAVREGGMHKV